MIEQQWEIQNPDADCYNRQFWKIADYNLSTNKLAFIHFNYPFINMFIPSMLKSIEYMVARTRRKIPPGLDTYIGPDSFIGSISTHFNQIEHNCESCIEWYSRFLDLHFIFQQGQKLWKKVSQIK